MESRTQPVLSLCMIVKNEKENLPRCLSSAKPYVDEIIVVDTGSVDGTPEIAAEYGAKVSYFEWCDDFAAARNYAISQASGDWILMLDADEELVVNSDNYLEEIISNPNFLVYALTYSEVNDRSEATPYYRNSLFRNISGFSYARRFHEFLTYQNQNISDEQRNHLKNIRVVHHGFNKEQLKLKNITRNIPIMEGIRQKEGLSIMLLYCLAGMYNDTQQPDKAEKCYAEAFDLLLPNLIDGTAPQEFTFIPSLTFNLGMQFLQQQDYETSRLVGQRGLEWCPNSPLLNYLAGSIIKALGFPLGAVAYFENCLRLGQEGNYYKGEPFEPSYMTIYPAYDLGCTYIDMERPEDALKSFELALSFDANFTAAQEKIDIIRQYLANQS
jgi:glycosyltransferase involved in cell wall biosynthesis